METVFLKILNMSIAAGWLVLAVTLLRFILKKAPKRIMGILWAFVGMRLLLPISLESRFSLIPSAEVVPQDILLSQMPQIQSGIPIINNVINPAMSNSLSPSPIASANPMQIITYFASVVWMVGMTAMLLYTLISYLRLKKQVSEAVLLRDNIWICDRISSPFILGVRKPRIYIPSKITDTDLHYVLSHENAHLERRDHIWKPIAFLLLAIYWFNPLMWLAYVLLCRDIELACDEKVLAVQGEASKKPYSDALINCSVSRKNMAACPLAFGEAGVKERVKNVLNYKKPAFWIAVAAIAVCLIVAVCFLTNPQSYKSLSGKLGVSMDMAVAEHNSSPHSEGAYAAADYHVLRIKKDPGKTTVYAWILYEEFVYDGNDVKVVSGSHIPTVITFDTSDKGDRSYYDVIEYWQPRDGSYYSGDICSKFPITLWLKASDNSCIDQQRNRCYAEALDYFTATDLRPMVMVDGVIFTDTGKEVPVEIEPSAIIGKITSTVAGDTRPTEDGQSNFGCEGSPYAYCEDGLVVLIDNEWVLFERDDSSASAVGGVEGPKNVILQTPNPWHSFETLKDAEEYAGFELGIPETVSSTYKTVSYSVMDGDSFNLLQVEYQDDDYEVEIRKSQDVGRNISGVYGFEKTYTTERNGVTINTYRPSDKTEESDAVLLAFDYNGFAWSLYAKKGYWGDSCEDFINAIFTE